MAKSVNIEPLLEVMQKLRSPDSGCAWNLAQTFSSIIPYTIEEVYEVVDAIERGNKDDLCEELGDLLYQIVFYAQLASEEGSFTFDDIVKNITAKIIRRHPHILGENPYAKNDLEKQWNAIKQQERLARQSADERENQRPRFLDAIKTALPTYEQALALQRQAALIGFDWQNSNQILAKIAEESDELLDALNRKDRQHVEEEFGDLLFSVLNLARYLSLDPRASLNKTNRKFRARFGFIEDTLALENRTVQDATLPEMERFWQMAKREEDRQVHKRDG